MDDLSIRVESQLSTSALTIIYTTRAIYYIYTHNKMQEYVYNNCRHFVNPRKKGSYSSIILFVSLCISLIVSSTKAQGQLLDRVGVASHSADRVKHEVIVERANVLGVPPPDSLSEQPFSSDYGQEYTPYNKFKLRPQKQAAAAVAAAAIETPTDTGKITRVVAVQKVQDKIDKSNETKVKGVPPIFGLEEEIQIIGWTKPKPHGYLGINGVMTVEFLWTITRIDFNTTSDLEMIYLDKNICKLREKRLGKKERCLYMPSCKIGNHEVKRSLRLTSKGNFQVKYIVKEGDKAFGTDPKQGLQFVCQFVDMKTNENATITKDLEVGVLATKPVGSKATVIKPENKKKIIVGDVITVESELDRDGLHIVPDYCRINTASEVKAIDLGRGLYTIDYQVRSGDPDRPQGQLPFRCTFEDDGGNNVTIGPIKLKSWFSINANPPSIRSVRVLAPHQSPARIGSVVKVGIRTKRRIYDLKVGNKCTLNAIDVSKSANLSAPGFLTVELNVTSGQADWFGGKLPIHCQIEDGDGNVNEVNAFTDGNLLAGDAHTPRLSDYFPGLVLTVGFAVVGIASKQVALYFPQVGMPLITGYLATGIIAGPEMLGLIPDRSIRQLRFIDEVSLAVIALSAGQKLYLPTMRPRFKSIGWVMLGLVVFEYAIGTATIFFMHPYIKFMKHMDFNQITAVALMAGALVCARSPASAVAIVKEVDAEGPFTSTILGVTVLSDVVVIGLFALTSLVSNSLLANRTESSNVFYVFLAQIICSTAFGYILSFALKAIIGATAPLSTKSVGSLRQSDSHSHNDASFIDVIRAVVIMSVGFSTFVVSHLVDPYLQPLIVCMVGGFLLANYSNKKHKIFKASLEIVTPTVYVAFFTLAGAALDLKSLAQTVVISSIIFGGRIVGILIGASFGGYMSGEPNVENRLSWMAYITQAGVTLGLAKKIHLENRVWGGGFATVIIACVVLNQVAGPPLFRLVMELIGEAGNAKRNINQLKWPKPERNSNGVRESKRILILQADTRDGVIPEVQSMILHGHRIHTRVIGIDDLANAGLLTNDVVGNDENDAEAATDDKPLLGDYMMKSPRRRRPSRDFLDIVSDIKLFSKKADVIVLVCKKGASTNIINGFGDLKDSIDFIVIDNPSVDINIIKSNILKTFLK
jgi:Kef-type K+ transport system membrane component KefB